jgi:signal transduction histidine kinase
MIGGEQWAKGVRLESLANLAHELRTPLQVLLGYIDALRDDLASAPPARAHRMVDRMNANANELARIVENIMEFAPADVNAEYAGETEVALFDLLDEVMPAIEAANQEKGLKVHLEIDTAPTMIRACHRPLRLILANLAVNAIRFTPAGSVTIAIRGAGTEHYPEVEIEVSDTGPGFDSALAARMLEPFEQLSTTSERHFRGVGLGLTVVKRNVDALGGVLEVSSEPGQGARFIVRIPVRAAAPRRQPVAIVEYQR